MSQKLLITVTDGKELYRVPAEQLPEVVARGLVCPVASSETLVGNGEYLFQVPVEDVEAAAADGLEDLLTSERVQWARYRENGNGVGAAVTPQPVVQSHEADEGSTSSSHGHSGHGFVVQTPATPSDQDFDS